jgi:protocatechuate 3,4-dioxygenase beta subunit
MDGPVSDMIRAQKRHGYRPSHIHFLVGAPGYRELVAKAQISAK